MYRTLSRTIFAAFLVVTFRIITTVSAAKLAKTCESNITEPNVPILRIPGIELHTSCELAIRPRLHQCHTQYVDAVREAFVRSKCYDGAESVRRAACCSLWDAKRCMIEASEDLSECNANITELYRQLPIGAEDRKHVLDRCSEYDEDAAACENIEKGGFSIGVFFCILLVFISIPAIVFGAMKAKEFYEDYRKFNEGELSKGGEGEPLSDDSSPLKEKELQELNGKLAND